MLVDGFAYPVYITPIAAGERGSRRAAEEAAVAALVAEAFGEGAERRHDSLGAPVIYRDGKPVAAAVTLSHSTHTAALAVAPASTAFGIDLEEERAQLARVVPRILSEGEREQLDAIKQRILSEEERALLDDAKQRALSADGQAAYTQCLLEAWTLKEALYKASRALLAEEVDFASQLRLPHPGSATAEVLRKDGTLLRTFATQSRRIDPSTLLTMVY